MPCRCSETLALACTKPCPLRAVCAGCAACHLLFLYHPVLRVFGRSGGPWGYKVALRETLPHSLLYDIVVDPLDAYVLTTDQDGMMRQWDATTGAVLRVMEPQVGAGE